MNFIKKIIIFFKKENIKMLPTPTEFETRKPKMEFKNSLKIKVKKKNKTLICVGDGLGIENKIVY